MDARPQLQPPVLLLDRGARGQRHRRGQGAVPDASDHHRPVARAGAHAGWTAVRPGRAGHCAHRARAPGVRLRAGNLSAGLGNAGRRRRTQHRPAVAVSRGRRGCAVEGHRAAPAGAGPRPGPPGAAGLPGRPARGSGGGTGAAQARPGAGGHGTGGQSGAARLQPPAGRVWDQLLRRAGPARAASGAVSGPAARSAAAAAGTPRGAARRHRPLAGPP
ncbi:MAG: hypothetical protein OZX49_01330 [Immundisolibacter sp.]|nr:hypothetical protein [Immundisolibacter sp.]